MNSCHVGLLNYVLYIYCAEKPAQILQSLGDQKVTDLPGTVTFMCALSRPVVPTHWKKDEKLIEEGDKFIMSGSGGLYSLTVKNIVGADDIGIYQLNAGELTAAAKLSIEGNKLMDMYNAR